MIEICVHTNGQLWVQDKEAEIQKALDEAQEEVHKYADMLEAKDKASRSIMAAKNQVGSGSEYAGGRLGACDWQTRTHAPAHTFEKPGILRGRGLHAYILP
jgi:hypothetical protein